MQQFSFIEWPCSIYNKLDFRCSLGPPNAKKRQLDAWVADSVYDIMGLNTSFCLFGICQKNQQKQVVIWGIV